AEVYHPQWVWIGVQGGFSEETPAPSRFVTSASQVSDDLTLVRGNHQLSFGGNVAYWRYYFQSHARSGGVWQFTGDATGRGLRDLLLGGFGAPAPRKSRAARARWTRYSSDGPVVHGLLRSGHVASGWSRHNQR